MPQPHNRATPSSEQMTILGAAHIHGVLGGYLAACKYNGDTTLWALTTDMEVYDRVCSDAPDHRPPGLFWINPKRPIVQVIAVGCEWLLAQTNPQENGLQLAKINSLMLSPDHEEIFHATAH